MPDPALAWFVVFDGGGTYASSKGYGDYVRLVRSGQSFDDFDLVPTQYLPTQYLPLVANQWRLMGLPLNVGDYYNSAYYVFGDDLEPLWPGGGDPPFTYGDRWGLYDWNAADQQYHWLDLFETPLDVRKGYWLMTLDSGQSIDVRGVPNPAPMYIRLVGDLAGHLNLVGYPYVTEGCWADAVVVDGDSPDLSLAQADPAGTCWTQPAENCLLSRIILKWNGSAYQAYDGQTEGAKGTLNAFDGLWVNAFKDGLYLRLPNTCGTPMAAPTLNAASVSANAAATSSSSLVAAADRRQRRSAGPRQPAGQAR